MRACCAISALAFAALGGGCASGPTRSSSSIPSGSASRRSQISGGPTTRTPKAKENDMMKFKVILITGVIVFAGWTAPALAQSRKESDSSLRARCDQALAARGQANASRAVRERCVANLRKLLAAKPPRRCHRYSDQNTRGWSMDEQSFLRADAQGFLTPCPGWDRAP